MKRIVHGLVVCLPLVLMGACKDDAPGKDAAAPAPAPAVDPRDPNVPHTSLAVDANARLRFAAANIYKEDDNGYPGCENPNQLDFGYTVVPGCPAAPIGVQLPMQSYCHMNYDSRIDWYQTSPPTSGDHYPEPSKALGVNTTPIARGYWVHSMEHGAVVLAYNCPDGCAAKRAVLEQAVAERADRKFKVLMTPDPFMAPNTFAAVSWTWGYVFDTPDLAALRCFIDEHYNHGRENDKAL